MGCRTSIGTIEIGKFADLTVLDIGLFKTDPEEWPNGSVTVVDERVVYH